MVTKPKVHITTTASTSDDRSGSNNTNGNVDVQQQQYSSYQNNDISANSNNSNNHNPYVTPPTIHQYHEVGESSVSNSSSSIFHTSGTRGDASLLPNIGRTNRYAELTLFNLAYHELIIRLQICIIITAFFVLLLLFLTWYMQLFQPIHLIYSTILALLSFILFIVEGKVVYQNLFDSTSLNTTTSTTTTTTTTSTTTMSSTVPITTTTIHTILQRLEHYGTILLYHPIGKTGYLLVCSLLCFSITGIILFLFGLLFFGEAMTLIYCYITYPECRQSFVTPKTTSTPNTTVEDPQVSRSWSSYYSDVTNTATVASWVSERAALLRT